MIKYYQPPTPIRLRVPHVVQTEDSDCLVACVTMVLGYKNRRMRRRRLLRLLQTQDGGTFFPNLDNLEQAGVRVFRQTDGTLDKLYNALKNNHPCIVAVQTAELPLWNGYRCDHAVVVVGMNSNEVLINDPAFPIPAIRVSIGDFDLAWFEGMERYAVLIPEK